MKPWRGDTRTTLLPALVWTVNASSVSANVAVYLYCAHVVLRQTGSVFLSSLVFSAQWVLPIVLGAFVPRINARWSSRSVIAVAVLLELLVLVALPGVRMSIVPFVIALVLGGLELVVKVTRLVLLKECSAPDLLSRHVAVTSTGQFVGAAFGGVVFALFVSRPLAALAVALLVLYLTALTCAVLLPVPAGSGGARRGADDRRGSIRMAVVAMAADGLLVRGLVGLVAVSGLLQGFHNVARVDLPGSAWGAGDAGVGLLQAVAAGATVLGAFAFSARPKLFARTGPLLAATVVSVVTMCAATLPQGLGPGLVVYGVYIVFFEICFMSYQAVVAQRSSVEAISSIVSVQFIMVNVALAVLITAGGLLAEVAGIGVTAVVFGAACLLLSVWCARRPAETEVGRRSEVPTVPTAT
ncbi:hypothetical protein O7632_03705 [Solwaraspora sp. WMMD406]|uniref:hypothetical protein n=1 Tax=Solwaraspora sp. WMMD406 TaxID=3016095 RepID=UPI002417EE59|nr:hypothetical protein [Solwaraspora sp. WMMD406]MDG4763218.1 hypothetical protein [Solwaraspora sp. WMMD406]